MCDVLLIAVEMWSMQELMKKSSSSSASPSRRGRLCLSCWWIWDVIRSFCCNMRLIGSVPLSKQVPVTLETPWLPLLASSLRFNLFCRTSLLRSHKSSNCLLSQSVKVFIWRVTSSDVTAVSGVVDVDLPKMFILLISFSESVLFIRLLVWMLTASCKGRIMF